MIPATGGPRRGTLLRRVLAAVSLALLCVGVPCWLVRMGGVPFGRVDVGMPLHAALGNGPVDVHGIGLWFGQWALVAAWSAWAWLATCVVLEARYWLSGRPPADLPGSRRVQWLAAGLVGTAFALGGFARAPHPIHPLGSPPSAAHHGTQVPTAAHRTDRGSVPSAAATPAAHPTYPGDRPVSGPGPVLTDVEYVPTDDPTEGWSGSSTREAGAPRSGRPPSAAASAPVAVEVVHEVGPRDTLWSVAERRLGSALRWRELAECNYGRPQVDGGALTDDHWIRPGWVLVLPSGTDGAPLAAGSVDTGAPDVDGPPVGTRTAVGTRAATTRARSPRTPVPDVRQGGADDPSVTPVGDEVVGAAPDPTSGPRAPREPREPREPLVPLVPVVPVGAGITGVGVIHLVDRLRRVQQRRRDDGARILLPGGELRRFEQRLRVGDGPEELRVAMAAVERYLTAPWRPPGSMVTGVIVDRTDVELVIDGQGSGPPPSDGFRAVPGRTSVLVSRRLLGGTGSTGRSGPARFPLPLLVSLGRSGERLVLCNLESFGSLSLGGDPARVEGMMRAMALELATSRWGGFDLVLVGFGTELARFDRVAVADGTAPLLADLTWRRLRSDVARTDGGWASVGEARLADPRRQWDPTIVLCGPGTEGDEVAALAATAGVAQGITVVSVGGPDPTGSGRHVTLEGEGPTASLDDLVDLFDPQGVSVGEVDDVLSLLDVASGTDGGLTRSARGVGEELLDDPSDATPHEPAPSGAVAYAGRPVGAVRRVGSGPTGLPADGSVPAADPTADATGRMAPGDVADSDQSPHGVEVEVAVLGPVDIRGASRSFTRAWARELVVYLAMHPEGASNELWATALWPERLMAPSSLHSTASVARRALGTGRDGTDHLPRSHGRLALAPSVGTDWQRFVTLAERDDPGSWRRALELVRGRPFDGLRSTDWTVLEGIAPSIESAVVDLSGRLAGACLRAGDPRGAEWSARRGLLVSPYDERLYRMLLRAADAAGNPSGVESVMAELVRVVADEIEPVESVHPSTLALYRSLSRRRAPVGGA